MRLRTLSVALGVALAASVLSPVAAQAAPAGSSTGDFCAVILTHGAPADAAPAPSCFGTFTEAVAFGSRGAITDAPATAATAVRSAAFEARVTADRTAAAPAFAPPNFLGVEFEFTNYTGDALSYWGNGPACTTTTGDVDYQIADIGSAWWDRISSFTNYNNCFTRHFYLTNFASYFTAYQNDQPDLPFDTTNVVDMDDDTRSIRWS